MNSAKLQNAIDSQEFDNFELVSMWEQENPQPQVKNHESHIEAFNAAMWIMKKEDFVCEIDGIGNYDLAENHIDLLSAAIKNSGNKSSWQAAYEYAEQRNQMLAFADE